MSSTVPNATRLKRDVEDLLTCPINDIDDIYEQALDLFERYTAPGWYGSFRSANVDGRLYYDGLLQRAGGRKLKDVAAIQEIDGSPILDGPSLKIASPRPDDINRFKAIDMRGPEFENTPIKRHFLDPYGFHSCFRIMTYRERRFTGWIGTFRSGDEPVFDDDFARPFQELSNAFKVVFSTAEQLHSRDIWGEEKFAIFTARGKLDFASSDLRDSLKKNHLRRLGEIVRNLDAGDVSQCVRLVDGIEVRLSRLEGQGLFRYLAQFVNPTPVLYDPLTPLTKTQREVALLAAQGLSNPEIADQTGRSTNTIKVHLRHIYERLDISRRLELTELLS